MPETRISLLDLTRAELAARLAERGLSPVHAARVWSYLYWDCVSSVEEMPDLPAKVRAYLEEEFSLPEISDDELKKIATVGDLVDYVSRFVQD